MMEAPLSWVYSHTARFLGKVQIFVQEGEGFILIRRGEALAYCFRHGNITLRGNAAREYLLSQDVVEFSLCKYTEEEFDRAAAWCRDRGVPIHDPDRPTRDVPPPQDIPPAQTRAPPPAAPPVSSPSALRPEAGVLMVAECQGSDLHVISGSRPAGLACSRILAAIESSRTLAGAVNAGAFSGVILETPDGVLLAAPTDEGAVCVLAEGGIPIGRVRSMLAAIMPER
jgi:hypothetical protein